MSQPLSQPMSVEAFFAWQERQDSRYELVRGVPVRMMAGARNVHNTIVINILSELRTRLRGHACRPFNADSSLETYPGQIRRPDAGVDCGRSDPEALKAAEPKLVVEVMSPSTRDFDTIGKLEEYKSVPTLSHIVYVEPVGAEVLVWDRAPNGEWVRTRYESLGDVIPLSALGIELPVSEIYEGVTFPAGPRLIFPPEM